MQSEILWTTVYFSNIVHSETQYGKSLLDAHFVTTNRHLINFTKTLQENWVTKINSPRGLSWALSFNEGAKYSMIQLVNFNWETLDTIQNILKEATTRCSEYKSWANYIGFKRLYGKDIGKNGPFNSLGCVKAAQICWKVQAFLTVKPIVQFYVDMTTRDLVKVDNKTQSLWSLIFFKETILIYEHNNHHVPQVTKRQVGRKDIIAKNALGHLIRTLITIIRQWNNEKKI